MSHDYHDYVIKDGKFIGKFEEMYQNCDDPWHQDKGIRTYMKLAVELLKIMQFSPRTILDVGCGKGNYTIYMKENFPSVRITALDIAPTAIEIAKSRYKGRDIEFKVGDANHIKSFADGEYDLIIASELFWYTLPKMDEFIEAIKEIVTEQGYVLVLQHFYQKGEQLYGNEYMEKYEDLLKKFQKSNFEVKYTLEATRFSNHDTITIFRKKE